MFRHSSTSDIWDCSGFLTFLCLSIQTFISVSRLDYYVGPLGKIKFVIKNVLVYNLTYSAYRYISSASFVHKIYTAIKLD